MSTNPPKIKISQAEINDIYEITKEEPYPKVEETLLEQAEKSNLLNQTEEQREARFDKDIGAISEEEYNKNEEESEPDLEL